MVSTAAANDLELHSVDIEQAFVQADKLKEGANGRYFITPPPGSPDATSTKMVTPTKVSRHSTRMVCVIYTAGVY
jgi:hypothetical protein